MWRPSAILGDRGKSCPRVPPSLFAPEVHTDWPRMMGRFRTPMRLACGPSAPAAESFVTQQVCSSTASHTRWTGTLATCRGTYEESCELHSNEKNEKKRINSKRASLYTWPLTLQWQVDELVQALQGRLDLKARRGGRVCSPTAVRP